MFPYRTELKRKFAYTKDFGLLYHSLVLIYNHNTCIGCKSLTNAMNKTIIFKVSKVVKIVIVSLLYLELNYSSPPNQVLFFVPSISLKYSFLENIYQLIQFFCIQ